MRPLQDSAPSSPAVRQPRDLSPWSMFLDADIVVKVVMVILAFASLVTWTIFFGKMMQLRSPTTASRRANPDQRGAHAVGSANGAQKVAAPRSRRWCARPCTKSGCPVIKPTTRASKSAALHALPK